VSLRRKLTAIAILCFVFASVESGFTEELKKYSWEAGPEISYFAYEEPHFAETRGFLLGIAGSFTYHDSLMFKAEGRFSYGSLYYTSPVSGTMENRPDYIWEFRGLGGYDFSLQQGSILTPYIGIGYRYLNDNSAGKVTSVGDLGYERESNYYYSPVGVKFNTNSKTGWSTETTAEYDIFWRGKQVSHLGDAIPGINDVDNSQKRGYGLRGSVAFKTKAGDLDYAIEPFIRYWNIKDSEPALVFDATTLLCGATVCEGLEPANHSTEYGINFLVRF
jgi:Autotransporter beta-domain